MGLAINRKLTAEQRLQKAVVKIMGNTRYIALAGVLMVGKREVLDEAPTGYPAGMPRTAMTNGRDEGYFREFVDQLTDPQLRFVILHECYHKLYKHLTTWRHLFEQDAQLANMAADYVINCKIADDNADGFAVMPTGKLEGLFDPKYRGWDTAAVFADLRKQGKGKQGQQGKGKQGGQGQPGEGGFDFHDWEGAKDLSAEEQRQLARDIDEAIRQGALAAGSQNLDVDRDFKDLMKPQVDWREVLREFIQTTCAGKDFSTWRRPNRRYMSSGHYMPSTLSERIGELVIAPDMSGSTAGIVGYFLAEVKSIAEMVKPEAVRLLYWDTEVDQDERYETHELEQIIQSTQPRGGGGTDVAPVPRYMAKHGITPQAAVILTDGYLGGDWGSWTCPTLWVIVDNPGTTAPVGKTIHIDSNDL